MPRLVRLDRKVPLATFIKPLSGTDLCGPKHGQLPEMGLIFNPKGAKNNEQEIKSYKAKIEPHRTKRQRKTLSSSGRKERRL